ncbi:alpha/beta hydrolase [Paenibacillus sp. V4I7]|uniref:alpha/beta hydrolase n=1 Tax=Paenibacillus sp. V4I7 TaxID=3042307 RepID=UPI002784D387|nr:alpha/beta hydrolase [Paenibacillus sp. V4I7]MDQ0900879.1 acetyl esterase/lipase [Paenibacillus sp. V4I7]
MHVETIQLWDESNSAHLTAYILDNSQEFKMNQNRPAVIICPGGGYLWTSDREAEPVAMRFAAQGYHVFVLRYTTHYSSRPDFQNLPPGNELSMQPQPLFDLAKAILTVRKQASEWFIHTDKIAVCGFSAGGHLAASLGAHWQDEFLAERLRVDKNLLKPNALILGYPLVDYVLMKEEAEADPSEMARGGMAYAIKAAFGTTDPAPEEMKKHSPVNFVSSNMPPTYIWHTADDQLVYAANALQLASALAKHKVPYELHVFENGVHGLSLSDETTSAEPAHVNPDCQIWVDLAMKWLSKRF